MINSQFAFVLGFGGAVLIAIGVGLATLDWLISSTVLTAFGSACLGFMIGALTSE